MCLFADAQTDADNDATILGRRHGTIKGDAQHASRVEFWNASVASQDALVALLVELQATMRLATAQSRGVANLGYHMLHQLLLVELCATKRRRWNGFGLRIRRCASGGCTKSKRALGLGAYRCCRRKERLARLGRLVPEQNFGSVIDGRRCTREQ